MWILYAFAFFAGITNTIMAGSNTTLGKRLGQPIIAATIVYAVGLLAAILVALLANLLGHADLPPAVFAKQVPWWGWIGGALGAVYITAGIAVPAKIGAGSFTALTVTAAIITSIVMDHFGWVGFEQHTAGAGRIIGACLMIGGLVLVASF